MRDPYAIIVSIFLYNGFGEALITPYEANAYVAVR